MTLRAGLPGIGLALFGWGLSSDKQAAPDFAADVLPTLTKAGCNTGACHGAATGQGGFRLSLLGYDAEADYDAIVRELGGRRVSLVSADSSLIVRKAQGQLGHGGGVRLAPGPGELDVLLNWIEGGAPKGILSSSIAKLEIEPSELLLNNLGETEVRIFAVDESGKREERTDLAIFTPLDDSVVAVLEEGRFRIKKRGVTDVMVRYRGQVASVRVGTPFGKEPIPLEILTPSHPVDAPIWLLNTRYGIPMAEPATPYEVARRASLAIAGRIPKPHEIESLSQQNLNAFIEKFLADPGFDDLWAMHLSDWLLVNGKRLGDGAKSYHAWIRDQFQKRRPVEQIVRELLTASGSPGQNPAANFYRLTPDPRDMGEFVSRAFLGKRLACARCHSHPFDQWTQTDYHRFAALFAGVKFDRGVVGPNPRGFVDHPKTGKPVVPGQLGSAEAVQGDPRQAFANWLFAEPDRFARAFANLVWKHLMGRGVVEPVDDLRPSNPPSNPELLDQLATLLVDAKYDLRTFIARIAQSQAFRLSSRPNPDDRTDGRFFSRAIERPMPGPVLADAIGDSTGVFDAIPGYPAGTRAVQVSDPSVPSYTLDVLGRCTREAPGETSGGGLAKALHLMNSPALEAKVRKAAADLSSETDSNLAKALYRKFLSRPPNEREQAFVMEKMKTGRQAAIEDLVWALMQSKEFGVIR